MNAVNLLPADLRRGSGSPGRSGVAVYVLLGILATAVVLASTTALFKRSVSNREAEVARVEAEAANAEARAATLTRYKKLASETSKRVQGIKNVAAGRVNWATSLREVSQAVGSEVFFDSVTASTAPGVGGSSNALRGAIQSPAVEVVGCARDHKAVARVMTRFRAMDEVKRVSLSESDTGKASAGGSSESQGGGSQSDCRAGGRLPAQFSVVVFLNAKPQPAAPAAAGATAATTPPTSGATK
jgi:Tfp pilus assembly protein PilN